ncbi:MAG TPA: hypothetical protein PLG94_17655 [Smithellaceae bacterium]|nr:hypothetical protein [Smithellaceae bacterium]
MRAAREKAPGVLDELSAFAVVTHQYNRDDAWITARHPVIPETDCAGPVDARVAPGYDALMLRKIRQQWPEKRGIPESCQESPDGGGGMYAMPVYRAREERLGISED